MSIRRIALCDIDAVIVREASGDGGWHTVTKRMTSREARQLADDLLAAARYLEAKTAAAKEPR